MSWMLLIILLAVGVCFWILGWQIWKKEKRVRRLEYIAALVVAAALLGWFGFSVYQKVSDPGEQSAQVYTMDTTAVDEYLQGIMQEE